MENIWGFCLLLVILFIAYVAKDICYELKAIRRVLELRLSVGTGSDKAEGSQSTPSATLSPNRP
jgi:hypothetical protein